MECPRGDRSTGKRRSVGHADLLAGILRARVVSGAAVVVWAWAFGANAAEERPGGETLLFPPPSNFTLGFQSDTEGHLLREWIPLGNSPGDWTEMVTVQVFPRSGLGPPEAFVERFGTRYSEACPGTTHGGLVVGQTNGYEVAMLILSCPMNSRTGKPETTLIRAIRGDSAMYSVQHAWRSIPSPAQIAQVARSLAEVSVCEAASGRHPCPH